MKFSIVRLLVAGKPLTREARAKQVPVSGCLRVEEVHLEERARVVRLARLLSMEDTIEPDKLPPLHDPVLVSMGAAAFTLSGFELVHGTAYGQTWLCREAAGVSLKAVRSSGLPSLASSTLPETSHG